MGIEIIPGSFRVDSREGSMNGETIHGCEILVLVWFIQVYLRPMYQWTRPSFIVQTTVY